MTTYWDAKTYDRIGTPMQEWAGAVIDDLGLAGNETVLDAGCGSGKVTMQLAQRLPQGKIYALDSSAEMIAGLKDTVRDTDVSCAIIPIRSSLTDFELPVQVDCVFSNAVFHWISDDTALFASLHRATRRGGRLRAQCGGFGNISRVYEAVAVAQADPRFSEYFKGTRDSKKFRKPEEAIASMEAAGWHNVTASTFDAPVTFETPADAVMYLRTVILREHVMLLPAELGDAYLEAVVEAGIRQYGEPFCANYVRLNLAATT